MCFTLAWIASTVWHAYLSAAEPIDFHRQVRPILAHHCYECHARGRDKGGLRIDSRQLLMAGSEQGAVVVPGKSSESKLIQRVTSTDPDFRMPWNASALKPDQIAILRAWIDQGLPWGDGAEKRADYRLALRAVELPPGEGNPVDRLLSEHFQRQQWIPPSPVDDAKFARRAYLDLIGLLPTREELEPFLDSRQDDKREQLVRRLLGERESFVQHWMTFWCDHLRVGSDVDGGVFDNDLSHAPLSLLKANLESAARYDAFVTNLITGPYFDAYSESIAPEGEVGSPVRRPEMQHATIMTQVFLGVQLKCASCHDSFIDDWTLQDAWGMASAFGDEPFEIFRCQQPTGATAAPRFLFPDLGSVDITADIATRRRQVAELMTSPENGLFARTIVNRLWARLFGRGLVEPLDEMMVQEPWHPDLLEWLAAELIRREYELSEILVLLMTSQAYALPAHVSDTDDGYVFHGPHIRRLTAEQLVDALYLLASPHGTSDRPARPEKRAWEQENDRLMSLLGRPSRDAVVTSREEDSFPLQALEMINGSVIDDHLDGIAQHLLENNPNADAQILADEVYWQLLTRDPTPTEREIARNLLGEQPDRQTLGDFVWTIVMLPEFQLIH